MALTGAHAVEGVEGTLQPGDGGRVPVWVPPWLLGTTPLTPTARGAELLGYGNVQRTGPLQLWDVQLGLGLAEERICVLHFRCCSGGLFRGEGVGEERTSSDPAGGGIGTLSRGRLGRWARRSTTIWGWMTLLPAHICHGRQWFNWAVTLGALMQRQSAVRNNVEGTLDTGLVGAEKPGIICDGVVCGYMVGGEGEAGSRRPCRPCRPETPARQQQAGSTRHTRWQGLSSEFRCVWRRVAEKV